MVGYIDSYTFSKLNIDLFLVFLKFSEEEKKSLVGAFRRVNGEKFTLTWELLCNIRKYKRAVFLEVTRTEESKCAIINSLWKILLERIDDPLMRAELVFEVGDCILLEIVGGEFVSCRDKFDKLISLQDKLYLIYPQFKSRFF